MDLLEKQNKRCALSGVLMTHTRHSLFDVSIDRKDSKRGHTQDNVQLVCKFINTGKAHHTDEEALDFINQLRRL